MKTYRYHHAALVIPFMLLASIALPIGALFVDAGPWWAETLFLLIAIPLGWWYVAVRLIYRMELTEQELVLRSLLGRWRVPLAELAEIGAPESGNTVRVVRRDGRAWSVFSGEGLVAFADEVGRVAPNAEVRISGWHRRTEG
ncbi:hypothetical protein AB0J83_30225 [Actinoplanes sp. NPDC049596]|uniref:hypothetical protein n=1 Tax=unclassified Actinoplanes TaxID=2626549 RepID=UPI00343098C9